MLGQESLKAVGEAGLLGEDRTDLFVIFREYVESRLETTIKGSRLLP